MKHGGVLFIKISVTSSFGEEGLPCTHGDRSWRSYLVGMQSRVSHAHMGTGWKELKKKPQGSGVSAKKGAFSLSIPPPTLPAEASSFAIRLSDPQNSISHRELVSVSVADTTANWQLVSYPSYLYSDLLFGFDGTGPPMVQSFEGNLVIMRGKYKGSVVVETQNWAEETAALTLVTPDMQSTQITVPGSPAFFGVTYSDGTDLFFPFGTCEEGYSNCVSRIGKYSLSSGAVVVSAASTPYSIESITRKKGTSSEVILKGTDPASWLQVTGSFSKSSLAFLGWGEDHEAAELKIGML